MQKGVGFEHPGTRRFSSVSVRLLLQPAKSCGCFKTIVIGSLPDVCCQFLFILSKKNHSYALFINVMHDYVALILKLR